MASDLGNPECEVGIMGIPERLMPGHLISSSETDMITIIGGGSGVASRLLDPKGSQ